MRTLIKYFPILFLLLAIACLEEDPIDEKGYDLFSFEIGDTSQFQLNQYYISTDNCHSFIIDSINDSRCPEGLFCFWGGEVVVYGRWLTGSESEYVWLYSERSHRNIYPDQFPMTIVNVTPYPVNNEETDPSEYRVKLLIKDKDSEDPTQKIFEIGDTTICRFNEIYTTSDNQYSFYLKSINDSRCPLAAMCVWQGEVILKGKWFDDGKKSDFEIYTENDDNNVYPEGFKITIIEVSPYPDTFVYINPDYYEIKLLITPD